MSRAMASCLVSSLILPMWVAAASTDSRVNSAILWFWKRTASAVGLRRLPLQLRQTLAGCALSSLSRKFSSSPVSSSLKSASCSPVPKQDVHQPCRELNENSRGSRSSKLLPQPGQARRVENRAPALTFLRALPVVPVVTSVTLNRPLPTASASPINRFSSASFFLSIAQSPITTSISCSL